MSLDSFFPGLLPVIFFSEKKILFYFLHTAFMVFWGKGDGKSMRKACDADDAHDDRNNQVENHENDERGYRVDVLKCPESPISPECKNFINYKRYGNRSSPSL